MSTGRHRRRWRRGGAAAGLLLLALAAGGCKGRGATADASATQAPDAGRAPLEALACALLLPPEARETALAGAQLTSLTPPCTLRVGPEHVASFTYTCRPLEHPKDAAEAQVQAERQGGTSVPALGWAALRRDPAPGVVQVVAWDDDTPCVVVATYLGPEAERAMEGARTALGVLTAEVLEAARAQAEDGGVP